MNAAPLRNLLFVVALTATIAFGQAPGIISHQGKITVGGNSFTGTALFKFALVHTNGSVITDWSNDGTSAAGGEPTAAVSLAVSRGIFSVNLGDTTLANMATIPASVFANSAVYLRVWFNDGTNGSVRLSPDRRVTSVGYALYATTAASANAVAAENVTGTLALAQLPSVVLTNGASTVSLTGSFTGNGASLSNLSSLQLTGPLTLGMDPVRVGGYDTAGNAYGVAVAGNYAYVADYAAGLQVIDIGTPANPQRVGGYDTVGWALGVAVSGNYAYVADYAAGLQVINISNPANPQRGGGYNTTGYALGVAVSGNYAYVADDAAGLQVINISNPANPQRVGGYDTTGYAYGVAVSGNYAYVADDAAGLQVIDISNPANPQRVGGYDTAGNALGVAVSGNYAYVADGSAGLEVIDINNPANPQRVGGYDTAGSARAVAVAGNYACVADNTAGLEILTAGPVATMAGIVRANIFAGDAAGLTNLNAAQLAGGTLADARLSANVALLGANQAFTGTNVFTAGSVGIGTATPRAGLEIERGTVNAAALRLTSASAGHGSGLWLENRSGGVTNTWSLYAASAGTLTLANQQLLKGALVVTTNLNVGIGAANPGQLLQVGDASVAGSEGMIRLGSHSPTNNFFRTWDIGVPQTGGDLSGAGYSFVIDDTVYGNDPEFMIKYGTGRVGIGRTNPVSALDVNGTVTALAFVGDGAGLSNIPAAAVVTAPPGMVLIPAGAFTMGATTNDTDITDAATVTATVSAFYMDVNLVTFSQWQSVYYWATEHSYTFKNAGAGKAANHPVQTVDWYDCVKWCNARSEQAGRTPVYYTGAGFTTVYKTGEVTVYPNWSANGYRLPTEAEWEKAARGGLSGQRFPWGNRITQNLANYYGRTADISYDLGPDGYNPIGSVGGTDPSTSPVGSFAPNGYGLNDMAGNVYEWCWDWYGTPYGQPTTVNPTGPAGPLSYRVLRGGTWYGSADLTRCAYRDFNSPGGDYVLIGFRCVRGL
jgi:formylglycine-generating enzyme required for sulfatase activity